MKSGGRLRLIFGLLSLLSLLLPFSRAAAGQLEEFLGRVERSAASIGSFSCDFRQERNLSMFSRPVVFTGRLYLVRPDRLRWDFARPILSILILDGNTGRRCGETGPPSEFRLDRDPVMRLVAEQLRTWTSGGYRQLQGDFDLQLDTGTVLRLTPREKGLSSFLNRIMVRFNPETLQPVQVDIIEEGGDSTEISFSNYHLDPALPPELFSECKPLPDLPAPVPR